MKLHSCDPSVQQSEADAPELWLSCADDGDPLGSVVLRGGGGIPLFSMTEPEAVELLAAWWRHHRARYLHDAEVKRRRAAIRSAP